MNEVMDLWCSNTVWLLYACISTEMNGRYTCTYACMSHITLSLHYTVYIYIMYKISLTGQPFSHTPSIPSWKRGPGCESLARSSLFINGQQMGSTSLLTSLKLGSMPVCFCAKFGMDVTDLDVSDTAGLSLGGVLP